MICMRAYHALVDDLLTWEEFEARVSAVCQKENDEDAETEAARSVAESLGRLHVKIADLKKGPTLCSFFCNVIEKGDIIRFERDSDAGAHSYIDPDDDIFVTESPDAEPPGLLRRVLVGDDTGEAFLVFRDMKVHGTQDIRIGDVLEVAARFRGLSNVIAVDLQEADKGVDVFLRKSGMKTLKPLNLRVKILSLEERDLPSVAKSAGYSKTVNTAGSDGNSNNADNTPRHRFSDAYVWVIEGHVSSSKVDGTEAGEGAVTGNANCFARIRVFGDAVRATLREAGEGAVAELDGITQRPSRFAYYYAGDESAVSICRPDDENIFSKDYVPAEVSFERLADLPEDSEKISVSVRIEDAGHVGSYLRLPRKRRRLKGFGDAGYGSDAANEESEAAGGAVEEGIYRPENIFRVRRCIVSDASARSEISARLVLWGRQAEIPLSNGDIVRVYNCNIRYADMADSRYDFKGAAGNAGFEIHAGSNSCVKVLHGDGGFGDVSGVIMVFPEGLCIIESGSGERYAVVAQDKAQEALLSQFAGFGEVRVSGRIAGHVICAGSVNPVSHGVSDVIKRLENLENKLGFGDDHSS